CLSDRLTFDSEIAARGPVAVVELVDGLLAQARTAGDLLGRERDPDPSLGGESAPGVSLDVGAGVGFDLIGRALNLTVADVEHLAVIVRKQRDNLIDDVTARLSAGCGDRTEIFGRDAFEHASGRARLANNERRRLTTPAIDPRQRHSLDDVLVHAGGIAPCREFATLIENPVPRHEAKLAQSHSGVADVLRWCACPLVAAGIAICFRDDALLLQLVEQEAAVGRDGAFVLVLTQQIEACPLKLAGFGVGCREAVERRHRTAPGFDTLGNLLLSPMCGFVAPRRCTSPCLHKKDYRLGYDNPGRPYSRDALGWRPGPPSGAPANPCWEGQRQQNLC